VKNCINKLINFADRRQTFLRKSVS